MRAHVVVNRRARRLRRPGPLLDELRRPRPGVEVVETGSLDELEGAARELRVRRDARGIAAVVLAGGDGSAMAGLSALARAFEGAPPPIALAPGGTVCTVARNWGGDTGDPVRGARRLLDAIAAGSARATRHPTLLVREAPAPLRDGPLTAGGDPRAPERRARVGFILGAGLVARFFELYEARGARGSVDAARIAARVFAGSFVGSPFARSVLDPSPCLVTTDGREAPFDRVSLLCAGVVRDVGLGLRLLYRAGEERARFHAVASPLGPRALGPQLPRVVAARPLAGERVDTLAGRLDVVFPGGAGAYVLDGELFHAGALAVTAGPVIDVLS